MIIYLFINKISKLNNLLIAAKKFTFALEYLSYAIHEGSISASWDAIDGLRAL